MEDHVKEASDADRERFEREANTTRYPDAATSRIKFVATAKRGRSKLICGWGSAVGARAKDTAELIRVIGDRDACEGELINATLIEAMKAMGASSAITYCPADQFAPLGWTRGKSLYGKSGRYVMYSTDGKPKAESKPDDGRGIPRRK